MTDTVKTPRRAARTRGAKAPGPAASELSEAPEAPVTPEVVLDAEVLLDPQPEIAPKARAKAASGKSASGKSSSGASASGKPARGRRAASSPAGDGDDDAPASATVVGEYPDESDDDESTDDELDIDFDGPGDDAIDVDLLHGDDDSSHASHGSRDATGAHEDGEARHRSLPVLRPAMPGASTRDSLHLYLREISRFPLLKPDEEFDLARRVQEQGDSDAAFRLVTSHLRLVVKIAMDFQRRWMQNVLDLIQEGNVGLMRAVNKFDPEKGIKFSYYAAFWIKAYILKFIMDNWRMVKIGTTQAQRKLFYNLNKERQRLIAQGYDPDAATLSEKLNVTVEQVIEMEQRLDSSDMSLDITVGEDSGGATRMDFLPALGPGIEETLANSEIARMVQDRVQTILPKLSDKEAYILQHRLLTEQPVTLREIGEKYDITRERVRQIEARLLQKLRDHLFKEIRDFSSDWISQ
ncbi:sigma-70 family RNA polymerase sigma factor [Nitratidesulfovibrio termitidis]|uniref:sigma-70 family RNA polymerase sigma factor n=1 Tax=Nitratidesulfovibrio termitidis TaxID=42252 RepID=UPI00040D698C|nr:RNA polymerase factor sigma-32 [Nitratidesulfovibrio termitidis]